MRAISTIAGSLLRAGGPAAANAAPASFVSTRMPAAAAVACYHSSSITCAGVRTDGDAAAAQFMHYALRRTSISCVCKHCCEAVRKSAELNMQLHQGLLLGMPNCLRQTNAQCSSRSCIQYSWWIDLTTTLVFPC
jgi:hypothetical protein